MAQASSATTGGQPKGCSRSSSRLPCPSFDAPDPVPSSTDEDENGAEATGRLLFRVWLSPYNSRALPDDPGYRRLWGAVEPGAPRGGLEPALATGESSPEVLRQAMASAKHNYYGLYKRRYA